ncbi:MAG: thioredoxin domain-containing protein [Gemmatimonadota bacterium]|jgi:protein-disulfide isomerase|nr:MAG: thioredoxin domain-containing protein [Gemmatimonadota bacterium]
MLTLIAALSATACGSPDRTDAGAAATYGGSGPAAEQSAEALASIDGKEITTADLDEQVRQQLARMEYQYRSQRSQLLEAALEEMIQNRLLTEAAAERGVSLEEIVASETEGKVEVTDAEVEDWYQRNRSRLQGRELEQVAPQIRQYLEETERQQLVAAFASSLAADREITYYVEPARATFDVQGAPFFGPEDAPVTLVEFSDFECPFCSRFFPTLNQIKEEYGDRVRVVYLQFPLTNIHPSAFKAAEASLCAHEQDRFWEMHDLLFQEQGTLAVPDLKEKAERLGLDTEAFNECLDSGRQAEQVRQDLAQGQAAGINGTPAIFVNGVGVPGGAVPYEVVAAAIDRELRREASD